MLNALLCHSAKTHSSQNLHGMTSDVVSEDIDNIPELLAGIAVLKCELASMATPPFHK